MSVWPSKDPEDFLDYHIDWTNRLNGDIISSSAWTVQDGLSSSMESNTDTVATIWLSNGENGVVYSVRNMIETGDGRIFNITVRLKVATR